MKKILAVIALAVAIGSPLATAAYAELPGAYYQQQQSGYPQSPPGGGY